MTQPQWTFIGAGNMASSLVGGLVGSGVDGASITVVDINADACSKLRKQFNVNTLSQVDDLGVHQSVVIAVKPNIVETVCCALASREPDLVVSVAAGVRSDAISEWLQKPTAVVRCMPNTPALLGLGATALFANNQCSDTHRSNAAELLNTAGITRWVDNENALDAVTALSGSGPAYFFYLIEHMISSAESLGLPPDMARDFAIETAFGAASMARQGKDEPAVLRKNVTSKGGTTAAALNEFDRQKLNNIVLAAMTAARDRAVELGDEFDAANE